MLFCERKRVTLIDDANDDDADAANLEGQIDLPEVLTLLNKTLKP